MIRCLSNAEMRRADAAEIKNTPSLTLMERAGRAIADEVFSHGNDVLVVCGSGNNGGDGYVAARYLRSYGANVVVWAVEPPKSADCAKNAARFAGEIVSSAPEGRFDVVADCLFGTGLSRQTEGRCAEAIEKINRMRAFVVSADIPSGLNGDNGLVMGSAVRADVTLAIAFIKQGCVLGDGLDLCGKIKVADIGIPSSEGRTIYEEEDVAPFFPPRRRNVHKGTFGKAVVMGGSMQYSGAALLSLSALLRTGVGYAELVTDEAVLPHYIGKFPEALLSPWKEDVGARAIAVGMGCGATRELYRRVCFLLSRFEGTLVIDADALNALSLYGTHVLRNKACRVIVTPHPKEFSRLSGLSPEEIQRDPVAVAEGFAREYGVVVVLKGAVSVVTDGERTALNVSGSPALAKGGSGDVLSGIVCGLASRLPPFESAVCGAYVLGKAGEEAAARLGEYAATASDVVAALPAVLRRLTEQANEQGKCEKGASRDQIV